MKTSTERILTTHVGSIPRIIGRIKARLTEPPFSARHSRSAFRRPPPHWAQLNGGRLRTPAASTLDAHGMSRGTTELMNSLYIAAVSRTCGRIPRGLL